MPSESSKLSQPRVPSPYKRSQLTAAGLGQRNPYVGPRPIQQGEPLYGRNAEVQALFCELQARRIVVLHSPSGAGKSSLVQAGLIPRLRAQGFDVWRPCRVNLDLTDAAGVAEPAGMVSTTAVPELSAAAGVAELPAAAEGVGTTEVSDAPGASQPPDTPDGVNRYALSAMASLEEELPADRRRSLAELATLDLSTYVQTRPRRKTQQGRPVVLLFDQFEEVLTVAPQAVDAKRAFFNALGQALADENVWALFIIREDFLAAFAPYRDRLPTQMANTFRLDLLGRAGAREAILRPAQSAGRTFVAVDQLVRDLSMTQVQQRDGSVVARAGIYVEPVQLQVVCRRLWESMPAEATRIEAEHIAEYASVSESLADYYAQAMAEVSGGDVGIERTIREWVGETLIVGGIRAQVRLGAAHVDHVTDHGRDDGPAGGEPTGPVAEASTSPAANEPTGPVAEASTSPAANEPAALAVESPSGAVEGPPRAQTVGRSTQDGEPRLGRRTAMADASLQTARGGDPPPPPTGLAPQPLAALDPTRIQGLLDSYLVRVEPRAGVDWFELSHDRLVEPVVQDNERWAKQHLHPMQVQAKLWTGGRRAPGLLLPEAALAEATVWAADHAARLTADERDFLRRSQQVRAQERRERRAARAWRIAGVAGLGALVVGALVWTTVVQGQNTELDAQNQTISTQNDQVVAQNDALRDKDKRLTTRLARQQGQQASMLAEAGGQEVEAVHLAMTAVGTVREAGEGKGVGEGEGEGAGGSRRSLVGALGAGMARGVAARLVGTAAARRVEAEVVGALDLGEAAANDLPFEVFKGLTDALSRVQAGIPLLGHTDRVLAVAYSPDGQRLATASKDGTVRLWDALSGAAQKTLEGHEGPVHTVAFSADGQWLASGSEDKTVRIWDVDSGQEITPLPHAGPVKSVAFSPGVGPEVALDVRSEVAPAIGPKTGQMGPQVRLGAAQPGQAKRATRIASASGNTAWLWHLSDDAIVVPLVGHEGTVQSLAFSPDGRQVATASRDNTARVWQANSGESRTTLEGHDDWVMDVTFSPDGTRIVTGSRDDTVRTWDADTGEQVATIEHGEVVQAVALSPDGRQLATATFDDDAGHLWDVATGRRLTSFRHEGPVADVAFSPQGSLVATASWDKTARSWHIAPSPALTMLEGHTDRVDAVAVSPDGRHIVTGSGDHTARVWDANTGALQQVLRGHTLDVLAVAYSPDGTRIITGSWDETARVWDADTGEGLRTLRGHTRPVVAVAVSPNGTHIATASDDRTARVWDAATGEVLMVFEHDQAVRSVVFTPDGQRVITVVKNRPAQVWELATGTTGTTGQAMAGELLPGFPSNDLVTAVAYSPDGRWFAAAYRDHSIRLWDTTLKDSSEHLRTFEGHAAPVVALAFSANGTQLASASEDGTARVWIEGSTNAVASLRHHGEVLAIAFVADSTRPTGVVTVSGDEVARVWSLDAKGWRVWGCTVLEGRGADVQETRPDCGESKTEPQAVKWPGLIAVSEDDIATVADNETTPALGSHSPEVIVVHRVELVLIPGGTFTMGSPPSERGRYDQEGPQHDVTLDSFYLARTQVTNAQYALYLEANPSVSPPPSWAHEDDNQPDQPVVGVSWYDAKAYCDWAGLVLPTEAQWEYAARSGSDTAYWFGSEADALERFGWFEDNSSDRTHSVGLKGANGYGLYDIHGNIWEWCLDAHGSYEARVRSGDGLTKSPVSVTGRSVRGGSYGYAARHARSAFRNQFSPYYIGNNVGFRPTRAIH